MSGGNSQQRTRLACLDGLRAIAALEVILHHISAFIEIPNLVPVGGMPGVILFTVISGMVMYMPSADLRDVEMPRPFVDFMARRFIRLAPAWYASLALCALVGVLFATIGYDFRLIGYPDYSFIPRDWLDVATHLTFTHSSMGYAGSINGPGWMIGIFMQLYFLLPLFLWVARRVGWGVLLVVALAMSMPEYPGSYFVHKVFEPRLMLPFLLGVTAARWVHYSPLTNRRFDLLACGAAMAGGIVGFNIIPNGEAAHWSLALAVAGFCVLSIRTPDSWLNHIMSRPVFRQVASFSYSSYLIHFPLLALLAFAAHSLGLSGYRALVIMLPGVPLIFACSWAFSRAFEKPFIRWRNAFSEAVTRVIPIPALRS